MKALILSGGTGSRLRPITYTFAKQLIPIANKPILFYGLESIIKCGIKDIYIIVGDTEKEIKSAVGNGDRWAANITYIKQEAPLGLAHAVLISENYIKDSKFIMYLGDNVIKSGVEKLVEDFAKSKDIDCEILLNRVKNPQQFGVAEFKGDKVVRLVEKPKKPVTDYALVGVYMFNKKIFEAVKNIKPSSRNELEITDAIQYLIDKGYNVKPHVITGWWKDTGKLEDLLEANRIFLEEIDCEIDKRVKIINSTIDGKVKIDFSVENNDVEIINSTIRGPVIIGKGSKIINSYIGPFTSIYHNCYIENTELEHSIVLKNVKIVGVKRITDSLFGNNVELLETNKKPKAIRVMVGDSSRIEL